MTKKLDMKLGQVGLNKLTVANILEHVPLSFLQLYNAYNNVFHDYDWLSLGHLFVLLLLNHGY